MLIVRLESLEIWVIVRLSEETLFLPQSCILTVSVTVEPVLAVIGDVGENPEYQKFGTPLAVVQFEFPLELLVLLLVKVTLGLWLLISVMAKLLVVS